MPDSQPQTPAIANYITTNRFYIELDSSKEIVAAFTECSGLAVTVEKEVYMEGGVNEQQRIFLKQTKFQDITLKRGMTDDLSFWNWMQAILDLRNGQPQATNRTSTRRNITILTFNQAGDTTQSWTLIGAVPVGWKTPSLQASGNAVAIEELTLAYEGLVVKARHGGEGSHTKREAKSGYIEGSS